MKVFHIGLYEVLLDNEDYTHKTKEEAIATRRKLEAKVGSI